MRIYFCFCEPIDSRINIIPSFFPICLDISVFLYTLAHYYPNNYYPHNKMTRMKNPFVIGTYVSPECFCDREQETTLCASISTMDAMSP